MPRPSDPRARERLLSAASQVFVDKGLDRAKVEDITHAAGLSKGAFYLHFASKEQAFTEILRAALTEVAQVATSHFAEFEGLFAQGVEPMLRRCLERDVQLFEVVWKHRAIMRLVLLEGGGSVDYVHLTETLVQPLRDQVVAAIELGIARGFYREDLDPTSAASFCSGGFNQLACQMLRQKKKPDLRTELCKLHVYCARAFGTPEFAAAAERVYAQSEHAEEQTRVRARPGKQNVRSA
jgi:AcrR family transcriptional regulator